MVSSVGRTGGKEIHVWWGGGGEARGVVWVGGQQRRVLFLFVSLVVLFDLKSHVCSTSITFFFYQISDENMKVMEYSLFS